MEKNRANVSEILRYVEKRATGKVTAVVEESKDSASNLSETQATTGAGLAGRLSGLSGLEDEVVAIKKTTKQEPFNLTKP